MPTFRLNKVGPDTDVTISANFHGREQSRTLSWSHFCFQFVGSKNVGTIIELRGKLESEGVGEWQHPSGGERVTVKVTPPMGWDEGA